MQNKFNLRSVLILAVLAWSLPATASASALIRGISGYFGPLSGYDSIVGAYPSANCYILGGSYEWSSAAYAPAYQPWTAKMTSGDSSVTARSYDPVLFMNVPSLVNGSVRAITGGSILATWSVTFDTQITSGSQFSFNVWGPTLNNFGVTGANNPQWAVYAWNDGESPALLTSGTGEVTSQALGTNKRYIRININGASSVGAVLASLDGTP